MEHRAPSSSTTYKWKYDVFLSFHGDDTRSAFISHLHDSLCRGGFSVFIDCEIGIGEKITDDLFRAIEESRIAMVVFSENYADSTFCLKELEKILECFKKQSLLIYPVFYHVDPSELRRPRGSYAAALARQEERFKYNRHTVETWKRNLSQAAEFKGFHLKPKISNERKCIKKIIKDVAARIKPPERIWGAGGIGKSTIARAVYNSIADNFEGLCFLSDVRMHSENINTGLPHLQETLLRKLVKGKTFKLDDYHEGIPIIKRRLSQKKKILLILDDVDKSQQLEALAGSCDWFGCGSRIIITTRDKQLLVNHNDVSGIYDVEELNYKESLELLSWHAFNKEDADSKYMKVCKCAIHYSCGFPLALELIGSSLHGKGVDHWNSALRQFKRTPHGQVFNAFKLSYDSLEKQNQADPKQVFLDLACFFNGEKLAHVIDKLQCFHGNDVKYAIEAVLVDKSLIKIKGDCVTMHGLIEDAGKEIVQQESLYEPGQRSRLWFYQDILHVLQQGTGTNEVQAIILDLPEGLEVQWSGEEFMKMTSLKMLVIRKKFHNLTSMNLSNCEYLQQTPDLSEAPNLRELRLDDCKDLTTIDGSVGRLKKLTELSAMRCKKLENLPSHLKLESLKHLNLFGCSSLQIFPTVEVEMKEIQTLDLDMTAITELPSSICNLIGLETLNMDRCPNLKKLPTSICTLPNLWKLTADSCKEMSHFEQCAGGNKACSDCSTMSSKMEQLFFSNCNLSDESLAFCLPHFTNMHIGRMPPNLEKFSAECCTSLTKLSKSEVLKQAFNFQYGRRHFIFPGRKLPRRLHYYTQGTFVSFWVRNVFPTTFLWILVKDDQDYVCNCKFSVHINDSRKSGAISSMRLSLQSKIKTNHIYICDLQSVFHDTELPHRDKWNQVKVSAKSTKEIYFGVHVSNLSSNSENIQLMDPRRYIIDHNSLLQKIQEQEDLEEFEEDMNLDSAYSTKSAESTEDPMYYHERDIMKTLRPYWDVKCLKVGRRSYENLVELHQIDCKNRGRIAPLGQLPSLRSLTIGGLQA
ncbi:TMV resistance protein N-like [Neltuma alba]|uniref:TMV resistance protein N-like n=1 Tax=Neltuma alba TaxID=207710 RepID=UPI0010A58B1F|nr:TMV resistance protein N-like [Prosopis alba]